MEGQISEIHLKFTLAFTEVHPNFSPYVYIESVLSLIPFVDCKCEI